MNKFLPVSDSGRTFWIRFPYGDIRRVKSTQTGKDDFQITVEVDEGTIPWFMSPFVHAFVMSIAEATLTKVQVGEQGKEPDGIAAGTQWEVMKVDHRPDGGGKSFPRWYVWPEGRQAAEDHYYDSLDFRMPTPPPGPAGPPPGSRQHGPPIQGPTGPPPGSRQAPKQKNQDGPPDDHPANTRTSPPPKTSPNPPPDVAPPRIARTAMEIVAIMDRSLEWALILAKKYKPNVAHIDEIAEAIFRSCMISGVRIGEDRAVQICADLEDQFGERDES